MAGYGRMCDIRPDIGRILGTSLGACWAGRRAGGRAGGRRADLREVAVADRHAEQEDVAAGVAYRRDAVRLVALAKG